MTFVKTKKFFLRKSKMAFEQGDIYPIWGTCLGFEQMVVSIAQECILKPCQAKDKMSTLIPNWYWPHSEYISGKGTLTVSVERSNRTSQSTGSVLDPLKALPKTLSNDLTVMNLTYNWHSWCLPEDDFYSNTLLQGLNGPD